jgi:hypothetical protein
MASLLDIGKNLFSGAESAVSNFLQKYPTPASFIQGKIQNYAQQNPTQAGNILNATQPVQRITSIAQQLPQRIATTPIMPFSNLTYQNAPTWKAPLADITRKIPQQLKVGAPGLQIPEIATEMVNRYGKIAQGKPSKSDLAYTALDLLPFAGKLIPKGIGKQIERSVIQILDTETGKVVFQTIKKGELAKFQTLIDDTKQGIAGKNIGGKIYHLTAKTPEQMVKKGAEFIGKASIEDIPKSSPTGVGGALQKQIDAIISNPRISPEQKVLQVAPLRAKLDKLGLPYHSPEYKGAVGGEIGGVTEKLPPQVSKATTEIKTPVESVVPPAGSGSSSPSIISDPVQVIIDALGGAKSKVKEQAKIYSKIRSKQSGEIAGIGEKVPGEAGYYAQLGSLKGSMPKVSFESVREKVGQPNIDALFSKVEQSSLRPFEKITAKSGLAKLLGAEGGSVPVESELKLLNEIFPPEFIEAIQAKRPVMQQLFANAVDALNIPRAVMATADLSAPLRQGAFLIGRPKEWLPAFRDMFKYAFSEKAYQGALKTYQSDSLYPIMRENKLALTDMGAILSNREETFMSRLVEKIPGFGQITKASNRAYSGFLNQLRFNTFKDLINSAVKQGLKVEDVAPDLAKFINSATGRGDLGSFQKMAPILNATMFSPRLLASRLNLLNPVYYAKLNPFVRKEALKSLVTFAGTAMTVLGLAKLSGAEVGADPRSADFGKIKAGNTRYDILAGFQQPIRLMAQLISGKIISTTTGKELTLGDENTYKPLTRMDVLMNFMKSKENPILGFASGLMTGQTAIGQPFDPASEAIQRLIPMVIQDMYDIGKEKDSPLAGIVGGLPGMFGVGVQTYGKNIPSLKTSAAGNTTVKLNPVGGLAEDLVAKVRGTQPSNIPQEKWAGIVQAKNQETQNAILKDKVTKNAQNGIMKGEGNYVPLVIDGKVKVIDTSFEPTPPEITGMEELDKKAVSKFNGEITQKANDIYDLYKAGKITMDEANTQLSALKDLKAKYAAPKAPKKVTMKKITVPKIKISTPKKIKMTNLKMPSPPKISQKKSKAVKITKIKPIKVKKLVGLTAGKKLV